MTFEERKFLTCIIQYGGAAEGKELPSTDRAQDKARTSCKRKGWAKFERPYWRITDAGRDAWKIQ